MWGLEYNFCFKDTDLTLRDDLFDRNYYNFRNGLYLIGSGQSRLRLTMLSDETYDYNFGYNIFANEQNLNQPQLERTNDFSETCSKLESDLIKTYLSNLGYGRVLKYNGFSSISRFFLKWFKIEGKINKHLKSDECRHDVGNLITSIQYEGGSFEQEDSGSSNLICVDFR